MKIMTDLSTSTKTILLIDNEDNVREVVELCLQDLGDWHVLTSNATYPALEIAEHNSPDAILLDISIRGSFMFLNQLRNNPQTRSIPVILLSAKARWMDEKLLQDYQIAGVILKPFNPITLPIEIDKLLNKLPND